jgi:hypothetical protein
MGRSSSRSPALIWKLPKLPILAHPALLEDFVLLKHRIRNKQPKPGTCCCDERRII